MRRPAERVEVGSLEHFERPPLPESPCDATPPGLYTADELYDALVESAGATYADTLDAHAFAWARLPRTPEASLAQALHDHGMDESLARFVEGRSFVGVMGGHDLVRGSTAYADAARLGRALGAAHTVATGGGPGAMEAANLGALLASSPERELDRALARLAEAPSYAGDVTGWARAALAVRAEVVDPVTSLGIPTWFYGHEPPNVFATAIAKYFRNATREAILLEVCDAGIAFLPGAAGTVQEIFQDACENYYAAPERVAPMVLVGREHWTRTLPAWPLLESLASRGAMAERVHLVDTVEDAAALLAR